MNDSITRVLDHWFAIEPRTQDDAERAFRRWFEGGDEMDRAVGARFTAAAEAAAAGRLDDWAASAPGRLALILLLDQVPRHLHRGSPAAFAQDGKALALASGGIDAGRDAPLSGLQQAFFYMPLQHAESLSVQEQSVLRYTQLAAAESQPIVAGMLQRFAEYARAHRDIIARFGRFPHRNDVLGRRSTDAERRFLDDGGPRFGQ